MIEINWGKPLSFVISPDGDIQEFTTAEQAMPGPRRYTSLVPTQLARLLRDADGTAALARFDGVLVGGAACPPGLVDAAAAAGARVVRTYGMSETSGGCVYDGVPLEGVRVRTEPGERGDAVLLGGPMLASGYLGMPQESARAFVDIDGQRWFRTGDLGTWDGTRLTVQATASGSSDGRTARRGLARRCSAPGLGAVDLAAWREATVAGDGAGADADGCCGEGPGVLFIKLSVVSRISCRGTGRAA